MCLLFIAVNKDSKHFVNKLSAHQGDIVTWCDIVMNNFHSTLY